LTSGLRRHYFFRGSRSADRNGELEFWTGYFDNNISYNGIKIRELHFNFIKDVIIKHVDGHPSTAGYNILQLMTIISLIS
jgi:hypothetical protein